MMIIVTCLLKKKIYKFKVNNKIINFPSRICPGIISNKCNHVDAEKASLKGNVQDFSVGYDAIDKSLLVKNIIK